MIRLEKLNIESAEAGYCVAEELKDISRCLSTDLIAHDVAGQWPLEELESLLCYLEDITTWRDYSEQERLAEAYHHTLYFSRAWDGLERPCETRLLHLLSRLETLDYVGDTEELELLGIIYGGTWEERTLTGYGQADWLKVYVRKSLSEDTISLYEALYFYKGEVYRDMDSGETYFIDHSSIWSVRGREVIAGICGVGTDDIKIFREEK